MARILIVDDEKSARVVLGSIVEGASHEVFFASDGLQALNLYESRRIDVVVTDLHMPHVDGLELIEALRTTYPGTQIVAVTGKGPDQLAKAKSRGVLAALTKPVDAQELLEAIAKAAPGSPIADRSDVK